MAHKMTIGTDPEATASALAGFVRGDVREGNAAPPPASVKFSAGAADESMSPSELAAKGVGNCGSIPRAAAPFVPGATHIGVQKLRNAQGIDEHHAFLVKDGDGIKVDGRGRATSPIPAESIHDECVLRGMNGGQPMPASFYQGAWLSPIWPPHLKNLSHLAHSMGRRVEDQTAYQGGVRRHHPRTKEGEVVSVVAHAAGRPIVPPADYVPPPLHDRYRKHPIWDEVARAEEQAAKIVGLATPGMAMTFAKSLAEIAQGVHPAGARLARDPEIQQAHRDAAILMHHVLRVIQAHERKDLAGIADIETLEQLQHALRSCSPSSPNGDCLATAISEIHAMLPGCCPASLVDTLRDLPAEVEGDLFAVADFSAVPLFDEDDRDIEGALLAWGVACCSSCSKGHACEGGACDVPDDHHGHERTAIPSRPLTVDPPLGMALAGGGGGSHGGGPSAGRGSRGMGLGGVGLGGGSRGFGGGRFGRGFGHRFDRGGAVLEEVIGGIGDDDAESDGIIEIDEEDDDDGVIVRRRHHGPRVIDVEEGGGSVVRRHRREPVHHRRDEGGGETITVSRDTDIMSEGRANARILGRLRNGDRVRMLQHANDWDRVHPENGQPSGWIRHRDTRRGNAPGRLPGQPINRPGQPFGGIPGGVPGQPFRGAARPGMTGTTTIGLPIWGGPALTSNALDFSQPPQGWLAIGSTIQVQRGPVGSRGQPGASGIVGATANADWGHGQAVPATPGGYYLVMATSPGSPPAQWWVGIQDGGVTWNTPLRGAESDAFRLERGDAIDDPILAGVASDWFLNQRAETVDDPILGGMDSLGMNLYGGGPPTSDPALGRARSSGSRKTAATKMTANYGQPTPGEIGNLLGGGGSNVPGMGAFGGGGGMMGGRPRRRRRSFFDYSGGDSSYMSGGGGDTSVSVDAGDILGSGDYAGPSADDPSLGGWSVPKLPCPTGTCRR